MFYGDDRHCMKKYDKILMLIILGLTGSFAFNRRVVGKDPADLSVNNDNEYIRIMGNKAGIGYEQRVKPVLDKVLSFCGLVFFSPLYLVIALIVVIDDPGPVFFTQKRMGKDKHFFMLHKFRTMKMSAPHDVPTHMLNHSEQYITRVGKVLRKTSLDELPQILDIFRGRMSIIGPRPALWNQFDLIAERDKYGANSVMPGLTGWAQINGRDELLISDKAKLDGEYVRRLKQGGIRAFLFDCKCFIGTIGAAIKHDGVVEGGTGNINHHINLEI